MTLVIDRRHALPPDEYRAEKLDHDLLALHHTVGGSATSSIAHWRKTPGRIATAYLIERDGAVLEAFPPECWAIHLFRLGSLPPGVTKELALATERRSIGIELASEGGLTWQDGNLWAFGTGTGKLLGKADDLLAAGRVVRLPTPWRGYQWFDSYEPEQIDSCLALVVELCERFGIPRVLHPMWARPDEVKPADWQDFKGAVYHAMLRPDKTDVHLGFQFERLKAALAGKPW